VLRFELRLLNLFLFSGKQVLLHGIGLALAWRKRTALSFGSFYLLKLGCFGVRLGHCVISAIRFAIVSQFLSSE